MALLMADDHLLADCHPPDLNAFQGIRPHAQKFPAATSRSCADSQVSEIDATDPCCDQDCKNRSNHYTRFLKGDRISRYEQQA